MEDNCPKHIPTIRQARAPGNTSALADANAMGDRVLPGHDEWSNKAYAAATYWAAISFCTSARR